RRYRARRLAEKAAEKARISRLTYLDRVKAQKGHEGALRRAARARAKEDWMLGPLAPKRDAGLAKETWGSVQAEVAMAPSIPEKMRMKTLDKWVETGDRVCVVEGREKGKIGKVTEVNWETETVKVDGVNEVDVATPEFLKKEDLQGPTTTMEKPIPIRSVRLVYKVKAPSSPVEEDVIVERVQVNYVWDPDTDEKVKERVIPGLGIKIASAPKPEPLTESDQPPDTLRIRTEELTWVPTLRTLPMPRGVIDELRNRFSKYRRQLEPGFERKLRAREAEQEAIKESVKTMMTPKAQLRMVQAEKRREEMEKKVLSEDMMAKLGQMMMKQ
ncbi:hypothetical protein BDY21DRAFT_275517, partial [Lineolata rhizophorae]